LYAQFLKPKPNPQCRAWLGFGSSPGFQSISSDSMKYPQRACPNSPIALGGIVQLNLEERVVETLRSVIFDAFRVDKMCISPHRYMVTRKFASIYFDS
jgi:hypothetical protein